MTSPPPSPPSGSGPRPSPPTSPSPQRALNRGTALPTDLTAYRVMARGRALPLGEAYARAVELERRARLVDEAAAAADAGDGQGYRVYHLGDGATLAHLLDPRGREDARHLIVGRHTQCDVLLPDDPVTSLRHVLVRAWVLDDGLSLLGLLDLESGTGFELADGTRQRSVVASGPVAFRVGPTWLIGLPRRGDLPTTLELPAIQQSDVSPYRVNPNAGLALPASGPRPSRITIVPTSVRLSEPPRMFATPLRPSDAFEIVLQQAHRIAVVRVSERDVGHGVLIGRDPKCIDAGVRAVLNEGVSRVHALAIRERDGIRLYDIASMNGITLEGTARLRSLRLEDAGTTVYLRGLGSIVMQWRAVTS